MFETVHGNILTLELKCRWHIAEIARRRAHWRGPCM